jgi:hypothetical protein
MIGMEVAQAEEELSKAFPRPLLALSGPIGYLRQRPLLRAERTFALRAIRISEKPGSGVGADHHGGKYQG